MKKTLLILISIYSIVSANGDMKKCEEIHNQADKLAIEEKNKQGTSMHVLTKATTSDAYKRNYEKCKKDVELEQEQTLRKSNTEHIKNHKN